MRRAGVATAAAAITVGAVLGCAACGAYQADGHGSARTPGVAHKARRPAPARPPVPGPVPRPTPARTGTAAPAAPAATARAAHQTDVPCGAALSALRPAAGETLALRRGCRYLGSLVVAADGVTVTAYGAGPDPVLTLDKNGATVQVRGHDDTIENLSLAGAAPRTWRCDGKATPAGHVDGVDIEPGARAAVVDNVSATGFYAAVYVMAGASGSLIENSAFTNNTELDTNNPRGSAGAFGVLLSGDANMVVHNVITGDQACSLAYGWDGSAVEVYGGSDNVIAANTASDDSAFVELGSGSGLVAADNRVVANTVVDGNSGLGMTFLITRGSGDSAGPVYDTTARGNRVSLTRRGDKGAVSYGWRPGDGTLLTLAGNYLDVGANQALYADGGYVDAGGNTFTGTCHPSAACRGR